MLELRRTVSQEDAHDLCLHWIDRQYALHLHIAFDILPGSNTGRSWGH